MTESALVPDKFDIDKRVEVDVLVETDRGGVPIRIGFEATDSSRRAIQPWVRSMVQKHKDLRIDKTVLVSKSGFTKPAAALAAKHGAEAVTFDAAATVDWNAYIDTLTSLVLALFSVTGETTAIHCEKLRPSDPNLNGIPDAYINVSTCQRAGWPDLLSTIVKSPECRTPMMDWWFKEPTKPDSFTRTATVTFNDNNGHVVSRDIAYVLKQIQLRIHVAVDKRPITLQLSTFMGARVGHQEMSDVAGQSAHITVSERRGQTPIMTVLIGGKTTTIPIPPDD